MNIIILSLISLTVATLNNPYMDYAVEMMLEIGGTRAVRDKKRRMGDDGPLDAEISRMAAEREITTRHIAKAHEYINQLYAIYDTLDMSETRSGAVTEEQLRSRQTFLRELVTDNSYNPRGYSEENLDGLWRILWPLAELRPISTEELDHIRNEFKAFVESENVYGTTQRFMTERVCTAIDEVLDEPEFDDLNKRQVRIVIQMSHLGQIIDALEGQLL